MQRWWVGGIWAPASWAPINCAIAKSRTESKKDKTIGLATHLVEHRNDKGVKCCFTLKGLYKLKCFIKATTRTNQEPRRSHQTSKPPPMTTIESDYLYLYTSFFVPCPVQSLSSCHMMPMRVAPVLVAETMLLLWLWGVCSGLSMAATARGKTGTTHL